MSALLVFSQKCKGSQNALEVIRKNKCLQNIISFHDVNRQPVPHELRTKITHVPTLVTKDGAMMKGKEVITWLESMVPSDFEGVEASTGGLFMGNLDGNNDSAGGYFDMDSYGESLRPPMTEELKRKIDQDVSEAYNVRNNK